MTTYISILRGINVSGHNLIKMDALRKLYEFLGFEQIKTYVQSGNVVFTGKTAPSEIISQSISRQIKIDFGFDVPVIVMTVPTIKRIIARNPFSEDSQKEKTFMHVTFLSTTPNHVDLNALEEKKLGGEEIILDGDVIYLYCPNGYGKTKLNNGFLERKLNVGATTRNWKTTIELLKIAQKIEQQSTSQ